MYPITDKAAALDFPDELYVDGFARDCAFGARGGSDSVLIRLVRPVTAALQRAPAPLWAG